MNLLKRLASFLAGTPVSGDVGLYYYIQSDRTGEVIRLRINPMNDLSLTDDESGYFVRKVVIGTRSFDRMEVELTYDKNRKLLDTSISGGKLVDEEAYRAQQQAAAAGNGEND